MKSLWDIYQLPFNEVEGLFKEQNISETVWKQYQFIYAFNVVTVFGYSCYKHDDSEAIRIRMEHLQ